MKQECGQDMASHLSFTVISNNASCRGKNCSLQMILTVCYDSETSMEVQRTIIMQFPSIHHYSGLHVYGRVKHGFVFFFISISRYQRQCVLTVILCGINHQALAEMHSKAFLWLLYHHKLSLKLMFKYHRALTFPFQSMHELKL